jgi:hypothetical protein
MGVLLFIKIDLFSYSILRLKLLLWIFNSIKMMTATSNLSMRLKTASRKFMPEVLKGLQQSKSKK